MKVDKTSGITPPVQIKPTSKSEAFSEADIKAALTRPEKISVKQAATCDQKAITSKVDLLTKGMADVLRCLGKEIK